jgi:hypothetical protein
MKKKPDGLRAMALLVLDTFAWLSLAIGVSGFFWFWSDGAGIGIMCACLASGVLGWGTLITHAAVAKESRDLHHEIMKAMRS